MKIVAQVLVLWISATLAGCNSSPSRDVVAAESNKSFKRFPENNAPRWCLRHAEVVVEPRDARTWPNSGLVELTNLEHRSDCNKQDVFAKGDKLYVDATASGRFRLKVTDSADKKKYPASNDEREWLPLTREDRPPHRFMYHNGTPNDFYLLFGEKKVSGQLIKYYRVEAFADADTSDACARERPSYVDPEDANKTALIRITSSFTCPNAAAVEAIKQTGVGGGGEED